MDRIRQLFDVFLGIPIKKVQTVDIVDCIQYAVVHTYT